MKLNRNSLIPILDNGHGGMIGGQYQTAGKRSPNWDKGILYEGMSNRWIVALVMYELDRRKVPYFHVSPELNDVTLSTRVRRANKIFRELPNTYLISFHSNAGGGTGFEGFTSYGDTAADPIAELFLSDIETCFKDKLRMRFDDRYDGDKDKEANYQILKKTDCPAFLLEILFMDNKKDYLYLWNREFQIDIANLIADRMEDLYLNGINNSSYG